MESMTNCELSWRCLIKRDKVFCDASASSSITGAPQSTVRRYMTGKAADSNLECHGRKGAFCFKMSVMLVSRQNATLG